MLYLQPKKLPSLIESVIVLGIVISIISYFIIGLESKPHVPILVAILIMITYGLSRKFSFSKLQNGMIQGAQSGMGAILLFFLIGILISSWMISGTIPSLMSAAFQLAGGPWFFAIVFAITAVSGVALGSSFTTSATLGVAFLGVAQSMDASLAITAGAIVSGAFFGDKMSPLSDTTNLASSIVKVDLFVHIRHIAWTTLPAFIISFILFALLSPQQTENMANLEVIQSTLNQSPLIHWTAWIPIMLLLMMTLTKRPAFVSIAVSSIVATLIAGIRGVMPWKEIWGIWFSGYVSETNNEVIDAMLTRGGINSMFFTISLVILALALGGLFFVTGIIPSVITNIQHQLKTARSLTLAAASTAIGINVFVGEQYLSILLTGEAYQDLYDRAHLARKNLSRTLEDAGTVINPLVPWSVCGVFLADVLDVAVMDYLPFAFFCLISPIITIIYGLTEKMITKK
ncbi:Na(+)/H(+) antiporter NhaC [Paraliobacillus sp. PM-2]|uniref:Na+/H+ antiporter NhaC n=1 Tax=Paraliobacillus sp. PM-2 TaxID=1462524 RepID=UPI00061C7C59|nr:Na+/H+ antiporter NhaC [Paraliobacillus sp. PM-2]CQR47553.1 Na(+)/H(+) antiporter NhaC [Paraliobacillus sp. PM-2]